MVTLGLREIIKKINSLLMDDVSLPFCVSVLGSPGTFLLQEVAKSAHNC